MALARCLAWELWTHAGWSCRRPLSSWFRNVRLLSFWGWDRVGGCCPRTPSLPSWPDPALLSLGYGAFLYSCHVDFCSEGPGLETVWESDLSVSQKSARHVACWLVSKLPAVNGLLCVAPQFAHDTSMRSWCTKPVSKFHNRWMWGLGLRPTCGRWWRPPTTTSCWLLLPPPPTLPMRPQLSSSS